MSSHVTVNGLGLTYKGTIGISAATIPDVCKTPSPAGPVPIPYPNVASQSSLKAGSTTVKAKGKTIAVKGSQYGRSNGDEPGTAGGVKSSVNMKATDWITYSFDVKINGKNACRHTDKKFHNNKNCADLAGNTDPVMPAGLSAQEQERWTKCHEKHKEYKEFQDQKGEHKKDDYKRLCDDVANNRASADDKWKLFEICYERAELLELEVRGRKTYIEMGCDDFDWYEKGNTAQERKEDHLRHLTQTQKELDKLNRIARKT